MTRLPGWRGRLSTVVNEVRHKPFSWEAQHDCGLGLAAPAVQAITGEDIGAPFRGKYTTAAGALKAMKRYGCDSVADVAAKHFAEIHPSQAALGDLVAMQSGETGWALGVVLGERVGVVSPNGFGTIDRRKAERAFRVG